MNTPRNDLEARRQRLAERAERDGAAAGGDPQVEQYRLIQRALAKPLALELPADFSAQVMARIARAEARSELEDGLTTALIGLLALAGLWLVFPYLGRTADAVVAALPFAGAALARLQATVPTIPWSSLLAAAISIGVAMAIERWLAKARLTLA